MALDLVLLLIYLVSINTANTDKKSSDQFIVGFSALDLM